MYTVLVISCHPDDVEIACAGTLLKCKERGDRVVVCHLCSGNLGHEIIEPDELAAMRAEEAKSAGRLGDIEVFHGGFDDLDIYDNNKEARDKVVNIIRQVNPDFIITHDPDDYMPDHTAVSRVVFDASFAATVPHYKSDVDGAANEERSDVRIQSTASGKDCLASKFKTGMGSGTINVQFYFRSARTSTAQQRSNKAHQYGDHPFAGQCFTGDSSKISCVFHGSLLSYHFAGELRLLKLRFCTSASNLQ